MDLLTGTAALLDDAPLGYTQRERFFQDSGFAGAELLSAEVLNY
jgi:hypothetical protein